MQKSCIPSKMAISDQVMAWRKKKRLRFYKYIKEKIDMPYYTFYYKFFDKGGHASKADVILFERLIEEFEEEYDEEN